MLSRSGPVAATITAVTSSRWMLIYIVGKQIAQLIAIDVRTVDVYQQLGIVTAMTTAVTIRTRILHVVTEERAHGQLIVSDARTVDVYQQLGIVMVMTIVETVLMNHRSFVRLTLYTSGGRGGGRKLYTNHHPP